jgi:hypothetical protein
MGKSECLLNVAGFFMDQDPSTMLLIQPTLDDARDFSRDRFAPMITECPSLAAKVAEPKSRDSSNTILRKKSWGVCRSGRRECTQPIGEQGDSSVYVPDGNRQISDQLGRGRFSDHRGETSDHVLELGACISSSLRLECRKSGSIGIRAVNTEIWSVPSPSVANINRMNDSTKSRDAGDDVSILRRPCTGKLE